MKRLRTETTDLQGKGAYRSRTGVSIVTKDAAQSACVEVDSVQRELLDLFRGTSALPLAVRQPPFSVNPHEQRAHSEHLTDALTERLEQAVSETVEEPV